MPQARPTERPYPTAQPLRRHDREPTVSAPVVAPSDPLAYAGHRIDPERRRGRGATINPGGRYEAEQRVDEDDGWGSLEELPPFKTEIAYEKARNIITRNDEIVTPYTQQALEGDNVTNIVLQDRYPGYPAGHLGVILSPQVWDIVLEALEANPEANPNLHPQDSAELAA